MLWRKELIWESQDVQKLRWCYKERLSRENWERRGIWMETRKDGEYRILRERSCRQCLYVVLVSGSETAGCLPYLKNSKEASEDGAGKEGEEMRLRKNEGRSFLVLESIKNTLDTSPTSEWNTLQGWEKVKRSTLSLPGTSRAQHQQQRWRSQVAVEHMMRADADLGQQATVSIRTLNRDQQHLLIDGLRSEWKMAPRFLIWVPQECNLAAFW